MVFWPPGMWILAPQPGIKPAPLALEGKVLTTGQPEFAFLCPPIFDIFNHVFLITVQLSTEHEKDR